MATLRNLEVEANIRLRPAASLYEGVFDEMTEGAYDLVVIGAARPSTRTLLRGSDLTRQLVKRLGKSVVVVPEGAW
jgi:nucleotide-binding universal stress UspA family protein